jgi:uncharacterized protein
MTNHAERQALLAIARAAVVAHVTGRPLDRPLPDGALAQCAGAFVTLRLQGELRGCIGHVEADEPLADTVADCARLAGSADPRFSAITAAELDRVTIEISVLGPLESIASPADVEIGRHGLFVELGHRRGLLLPQVATEWNWTPHTFAEQTCLKAGLSRGAWREGGRMWRFEAEVFGEG